MRDQTDARGLAPLRIIGTNEGSEVTEPGSAKDRIADGVGCDISIGVAGQSNFLGPQQSGQPQRPPVGKSMDIGSDTHAWREGLPIHRDRRLAMTDSASTTSIGLVTLNDSS